MTGKLKYYKHDPNGKGRGAGFYYHRGNHEYSKYSAKRDAKISARHKMKSGNWRYMHTDDGTFKMPKSSVRHRTITNRLVRGANRSRRI
jgi:hypothetical protein